MPTDFPTKGDDEPVSLDNSQYPEFDRAYTERIEADYPDIWDKGGNIRGNEAFILWGKARDGDESSEVLDWIKEREGWAARHLEDFRIAGVVAQMKWGVIGSRGQAYMTDLIDEEIEKLEDKRMTKYMRALVVDPDAVRNGEPGSPIRFKAATSGVKRDGLDLVIEGMNVDNYLANPAFLWSHDYSGERPPIGRTDKLQIYDGELIADVVFDQDDEFARMIERKYRNLFLNAVSIGWNIDGLDGNRVTESELLDISAVNIPGDPNALMERQQAAFRSLSSQIIEALAEDEGEEPETDDEDDPEQPTLNLDDLAARVAEIVKPQIIAELPELPELPEIDIELPDFEAIIRSEINTAIARIDETETERKGSVLSKRNRTLLQDAHDAIGRVLEADNKDDETERGASPDDEDDKPVKARDASAEDDAELSRFAEAFGLDEAEV